MIAELKSAEDERLEKEAEEREKAEGESDEPEKKTESAHSKPKSGAKYVFLQSLISYQPMLCFNPLPHNPDF